MQNKEIHIVSFDIPYPPNYGGIIDVFFKIEALKEHGILINLHCYKYGNTEQTALNKLCKSVTYYDRPLGVKYFSSKTPYIVKTRSNRALFNNLLKDNLPILFEGLHTTYFLKKIIKLNPKRKIIVRTHNIEHDYYHALAKSEKGLFKKLYYLSEAKKLKSYENILRHNVIITSISDKDKIYFDEKYGNTHLIPAFHNYRSVESNTGKGNFILFHGNLSVNENSKTAKFILNNIIPNIQYKFIFAGKNPVKELKHMIKNFENAELIENPDKSKMAKLIRDAHIHLLLTDQSTGVKLKLINSLFAGRFCIANNKMIEGTQLKSLCIIKNTSEDIIKSINNLMNQEFTDLDLKHRKQTLLKFVNINTSAQNLINLL